MIIYHGSNVIVSSPRILVNGFYKDFGYGFYCTNIEKQAKRWALTKRGKSVVNSYEYIPKAALSQLVFDTMTEEWLDFVSAHRNGSYEGEKYDVIIGAVANDDVYRTLQVYSSGLLTKEQALEALKVKKLFNQYVFATEKALDFLKFVEAKEV